MRPVPAVLLAAALLPGSLPGAPPAAKGKLTDPQAEDLARQALASGDPAFQRQALAQLEAHHFKSSLARERELVLFAQGTLQDRAGDVARAAVTFHKLESAWPQSPFLGEAQVPMAQAALDHGRTKEAESRLNKALASEIPAESVRRCQELLLWCLADEGRASEGVPIVKGLQPLGTGKPTEKGMVGIMEALCAAGNRSEAEGTLADYRKLYPKGAYQDRMNLAWGKLLGTQGDSRNAAKAFQKLIQESPNAPEADEARMALATLLTDGSLPPKDAEGYPDAQALLSRVRKSGAREEATRKALMINLRNALKEGHWQAALDAAAQFRASHPDPGALKPVADLRAEASRGFAKEVLDRQDPARILPFLDGETVLSLTPAQRADLARAFAKKGLPDAAQALQRIAPAKERPALARAALEGVPPGTSAQATLALLPAKGEGPQESLLRAEAALALGRYKEARAALARAKAGPDRIRAVLTYLTRPAEADEKPGARTQEVEAWLARAPEKGPDREPLAILAANAKARLGDWKGALALYPAAPSESNRGWVALMRATCQARLGQTANAKATLKEAVNVSDFRNERASLARSLGI